MLRQLGAEAVEARGPEDLEDLDGLVIPGGESTTISKGIDSAGLAPAIRAHHEDRHLGLIDATTERNAYGRQLQSFEADLDVEGIGDEPLRAVFIRAPRVTRSGDGVEVLAAHEGDPVAIRGEGVLATSFHPELTDDPRLHALFMAMATGSGERRASEREEAT
jgi:5'-phosphate synthase pdxT subunit